MTTFYMDYEGGSDAADGTSFANRWKTFASGATAARTAPGDTIRIMASPDPTSLGITGEWTNGPLQTTYSIVSSTNATPIVVTIASADYTAMAPAVGDTIIVNGHTTNTKANGVWEVSAVNGTDSITIVNADGSNSVGNGVGGATGTARKINNCRVKLASALTTNIALCGNQGTKTNWTASANVTCSVTTSDYKEGGECQSIAIAAGFTTGLAAYLPITSLDLSGKQQVSFWIKQTVGTIGAAGAVYVALCTDAVGATPVHTMNIPALGALTVWAQISFDNTANMNAAIQSVAFYVVTDNGAQTFLIDNIVASNAASSADSLKLSSLVSKNTGDEVWYGIQSINGTRVMLDRQTATIPSSSPQRGYSGTTETVTTYKRETVKKVMVASTTAVETPQEAGTAGNVITYSGGWNRTDMSTQTGDTWWDGQNGLGTGISNGALEYLAYDKLHFTRYNSGFTCTAANVTVGTMHVCNTTSSPITVTTATTVPGFSATTLSAVCYGAVMNLSASNITIVTVSRADNSAGNGINFNSVLGSIGTITQANNNAGVGAALGTNITVESVTTKDNASSGFGPGSRSTIKSLTTIGNGAYGIAGTSSIDWKIIDGSSSNNTSGGVQLSTGEGSLYNFTINESTEVVFSPSLYDSRVYSEKHDGGTTAKIFCDGGIITQQGTTVHGSATLAWQFSPTSTNRSATYPLNEVIAKVACAASALVTVKAWFRRDNTGLTGTLLCKGRQIDGVAADVSSSMTAAIDTWEELTITFTPSAAGVVEIEALFYGGTTYSGFVSDMTISQS